MIPVTFLFWRGSKARWPKRSPRRAVTNQVYKFVWNRHSRKGQLCKVEAWGLSMNSCLVRFGDGFGMITSCNALRKVPNAIPANPS